MKHFILERDCYHGGVLYRKGAVVQFAEAPTVKDKRGEDVPNHHFRPIGAQSVSIESPGPMNSSHQPGCWLSV